MASGDRVRSSNFFRHKLLTITDNEELGQLLRDMQQEQREMQRVMVRLMWHMRGSVSREEAWCLSPREREDIIKLIDDHKELTQKTGLPLL